MQKHLIADSRPPYFLFSVSKCYCKLPHVCFDCFSSSSSDDETLLGDVGEGEEEDEQAEKKKEENQSG